MRKTVLDLGSTSNSKSQLRMYLYFGVSQLKRKSLTFNAGLQPELNKIIYINFEKYW